MTRWLLLSAWSVSLIRGTSPLCARAQRSLVCILADDPGGADTGLYGCREIGDVLPVKLSSGHPGA